MNGLYDKKISRILVVDDDEILNCLFSSFLLSKGFETLTAHSVQDAKLILQNDAAIDLILLDYQLGDGVGMDLLSADAIPTYIHLPPIIMISANEEPEFLEECFAGGVDDYIIKPVNLSLLALKVDALIKSVKMQRVIQAQNIALEEFKAEAEREEQVAKFTYEYLLRQNSDSYQGVELWLKSFAAFSGDMALIKKSPSGNLYFLLADATGHGLSAAITIMPVATLFNSMVSGGFHIQQIATEINRKLEKDTPGDRFVAAVLIEINPFRNELTVWNGSMPPVYFIRNGEIIHEFHSANMALGILDDNYFDANVVTVDLPDEGFLFVFSDGLSEQESKKGEQFGVSRVQSIIQRNPQNLLAALEKELEAHAGKDQYSDDVSVCVIEPSQIFQGMTDSLSASEATQPLVVPTNAFQWSVLLTGPELENCAVPALCNHFLQHIGVDQQLCQKVFAVIAEMVSNAVDHGVLGLDSKLKEAEDGFVTYFMEREKRFKSLTDNDFVKLSLQWINQQDGGRLIIEVEDSGNGFDYLAKNERDEMLLSGRGNHLVRHLSESVEIFPPGNKIRATIK